MPELTTRDYLSLLGLALVLLMAFMVVRSRRRKNKEKKKGFRGYLVGRILALKAFEGLPELLSRSEALQYAGTMASKFQHDYEARNGPIIIYDLSTFQEKLVDDLCEFGVIPKSITDKW